MSVCCAVDQLNTNLHRENQFAFVYYHELKSDFITVIEGLFSRLYSEGPGQIGQTKCESTSSYTSTSLIRVLHELELKKKHTKWKPFVSKHQHSIQQCCKISNQEVCYSSMCTCMYIYIIPISINIYLCM